MGVTEGEFTDAVRRMRARNAAPGLDGVNGKVLGLALRVLAGPLRRLYNRCLALPPSMEKGQFGSLTQ